MMANSEEDLPVELSTEKNTLQCEVDENSAAKRSFRVLRPDKRDLKSFSCATCGTDFVTKYAFDVHICEEKIHTQKKFSCHTCSKIFYNKTLLDKHCRVHTGEKPYGCEHCGKTFSFEGSLRFHKKTHTSDKLSTEKNTLQCEVDENSAAKRSFRVSRPNKRDVKSFTCSTCGTDFGTKYAFDHHICEELIHTQRFSCHTCSKTFYKKTLLDKHCRVHTGEKPYVCEHCGKAFSFEGSLRFHKKTHTSDKHFSCQYCEEKFYTEGDREFHMQIHTQEDIPSSTSPIKQLKGISFCMGSHNMNNLHPCKICSKIYPNQSLLQRHEKKFHDTPVSVKSSGGDMIVEKMEHTVVKEEKMEHVREEEMEHVVREEKMEHVVKEEKMEHVVKEEKMEHIVKEEKVEHTVQYTVVKEESSTNGDLMIFIVEGFNE